VVLLVAVTVVVSKVMFFAVDRERIAVGDGGAAGADRRQQGGGGEGTRRGADVDHRSQSHRGVGHGAEAAQVGGADHPRRWR